MIQGIFLNHFFIAKEAIAHAGLLFESSAFSVAKLPFFMLFPFADERGKPILFLSGSQVLILMNRLISGVSTRCIFAIDVRLEYN